jgi:hypothetical protein
MKAVLLCRADGPFGAVRQYHITGETCSPKCIAGTHFDGCRHLAQTCGHFMSPVKGLLFAYEWSHASLNHGLHLNIVSFLWLTQRSQLTELCAKAPDFGIRRRLNAQWSRSERGWSLRPEASVSYSTEKERFKRDHSVS